MPETYMKEVRELEFQIGKWKGKKGPIIGIHGLTSNYTHFGALAEELTPEYEVISFDLRGRGNSSPADEDTSLFKHAEDTINLIESMNIDNPVLMGHSMGGFVSIITAAEYNDIAGIVLLDSGWNLESFDIEKVKSSVDRLDERYPSGDAYLEAIRPNYRQVGLEWNKYIEASARHELGQNPNGTYSVKSDKRDILRDMDRRDINYEEIYPQVKCPILLIYATGKLAEEPLVDESAYDKAKRLLPNLKFVKTDANHYTLVLKRQPEVATEIKDFLKGIY